MDILRAENLCISFGGLAAVKNVSFTIPQNKIISLIGPNGAGITGFYQADSGTVELCGEVINHISPERRIALGMARTFQNVRLFRQMTVLENVMIGNRRHIHYNVADGLLHTKKWKQGEETSKAACCEILERIGLLDEKDELCSNLPYGKQKKLEIARALASQPRLLLLDEPAAGLNPQETQDLSAFIRALPSESLSVLLIEHDMSMVMNISDYIYVVNQGEQLAEGLPEHVKTSLMPISAEEGSGNLLKVEHIDTFYGHHQALWDVSAEVHQGEIVAIIGSNGAGKSTFLKTVAGLIRPKNGRILYEGTDITVWPANRSVRNGITLCPEGRKVFPALSVWENLCMGAYTRPRSEVAADQERVYSLFPILKERRRQAAGTLSGGEQQMLAIGRAMMSNPKLLMLDEPSLGLSPVLTEKIFELVLEIQKQGYTIILVEQNAVMALSIADRAYALQNGRITATGTGKSLLASAEIVNSYLG